MKRTALIFFGLTVLLGTSGVGQVQPPQRTMHISAFSGADLSRWRSVAEAMLQEGRLRESRVQVDTQSAGRAHRRLTQLVDGVPVFGGEVAVQTDGREVYSISGLLYEDISVSTGPNLSPSQALALAQATLDESRLEDKSTPTLMILPPLETGGFALIYAFHIRTPADRLKFFVDAHTGVIRLVFSDLHQQASVGRGTGVWNDAKKISTAAVSGSYRAEDRLRPPAIFTYDMKGVGYGLFFTGGFITGLDLATSGNNSWNDGAVVDAHTYAGWTYDYFFKRFGRQGFDFRNAPIRSLVHNISRTNPALGVPEISGRFLNNAFWDGQWLWYGEGDGVTQTYQSGALDVVAHEVTHGMTQHASNLAYCGESGALNESFSDIMAVAAEFFFQPRGNGRLRADWFIGEDRYLGNFADRSFRDPISFRHPDNYRTRYVAPCRPDTDNGGVHINSSISNHAFYLFVEGGVNRTSGIAVQGIGFANMERAERIFYRGFTFYLGPLSTFADARRATIQAARDLYGAGSNEERQLAQAWTAVGVN